MMSGECIVLLLCHETENPIEKWKKIIGHMEPLEAKVQMLYIIRNKMQIPWELFLELQ